MYRIILALIFTLLASTSSFSFTKDGCGTGENCRDCHVLTKDEARAALGATVDEVTSVRMSEVPGLWEVDAQKGSNKFPLFMDFSLKYVIAGNVFRLPDGKNLTQQRTEAMNRVDVSQIPVNDAILLGEPTAEKKVIVFTDPDCPYCLKMHVEMYAATSADPNLAFLIKMFPLPMHPQAYEKSKSIVCSNSLKVLNDAFNKKPLPPACNTDAVDQSIALAHQLGINSTPTLIMPDGRVLPGYKTMPEILNSLAQ